MSTISEALRELKEENKQALSREEPKLSEDLSFDVTGKTWDTVEDDEAVIDYINDLLEDEFLDEEIILQVDGGGAGPDEWYSEDYCIIDEIYWEDGEIAVHARWNAPEPPEDYRGHVRVYDKSGYAWIKPKDLGLKEDYTLDQLIDAVKALTLKQLNHLVYMDLSSNLD